MDKEKIVTIEDRIPKLKAQRKQKANRRIIMYLSFFFILMLVIVYFQSSLSDVKKIEITGNRTISEKEILATAHIDRHSAFLNLSKQEIEDNILKNKAIASVEVKKAFYNTLVVTVKEYRKAAYVQKKGRYYPLLESGKLLRAMKGKSLPTGEPIVSSYQSEKQLLPLAKELSKLPNSIYQRISEIQLPSNEQEKNFKVEMFMSDGYEVKATIHALAKKMDSYPSIVQQLGPHRKGVINMDVSTYFKEYSKEEVQKK
ncbi:cell division protein FtsQ [Fictibacillus macauensis ZFHKF-1]|uniref:Cell division protein DivIB n=1 Tax=Fictibacillus macauensis ZFHKF-1 TaxID=1196324 RepID=I8AH49_9BACL|nr:FtsQ-type POTRA domain-containing protein [Fictibacillus macauensis]EIT84997.1 cell division protein FtsQ [Fictibacillus macauensis ZFHKF-1]